MGVGKKLESCLQHGGPFGWTLWDWELGQPGKKVGWGHRAGERGGGRGGVSSARWQVQAAWNLQKGRCGSNGQCPPTAGVCGRAGAAVSYAGTSVTCVWL